MLPDDLSAVTDFDAALDVITVKRSADTSSYSNYTPLSAFARTLHATPIAPTPAPAFAATLRQSLLNRSDQRVASVTPDQSRPNLRLANRPWRRSGWWPKIELVGMVGLAALALFLINGGHWFNTSTNENKTPVIIGLAPPPSSTPLPPPTMTATVREGSEADDIAVTTSDVRMGREPSTESDIVEELSAGVELQVINGPVESDGYVWWSLRNLTTGNEGWIADDWLVLPEGLRSREKPTVTRRAHFPTPARPVATATQPTNSARFAVGTNVYAASAQTIVRAGPSFTSEEVTTLIPGIAVTITGTATMTDGVTWWPIGIPTTGLSGYVVEAGLTESPSGREPTQPSQTGFIDQNSRTEFTITVDADGVLSGERAAQTDAISEIETAFGPYRNCQVGFAQTFGYSDDIADGVSIAFAINSLMSDALPNVFANAVLDEFANVGSARGQVEIVVYFYRGCSNSDSATVQPTVSPLATIPAIAPTPSLQPSTPAPSVTPIGTTTTSPTTQSTETIVFLIDRSGSTSVEGTGGEEPVLELEKETIRRSLATLPDGTTIGVVGVNERSIWTVMLTELTPDSRRAIIAVLDDIRGEGGSFLMPSLINASEELDRGVTQFVLLADGKFVDHDLESYRVMIEGMVFSGAPLSTICFGIDCDTETMQTLAEYGDGIYHLVETAQDIPTLTIVDGHLVVKVPR